MVYHHLLHLVWWFSRPCNTAALLTPRISVWTDEFAWLELRISTLSSSVSNANQHRSKSWLDSGSLDAAIAAANDRQLCSERPPISYPQTAPEHEPETDWPTFPAAFEVFPVVQNARQKVVPVQQRLISDFEEAWWVYASWFTCHVWSTKYESYMINTKILNSVYVFMN